MAFAYSVLGKKEPLARVWLAANWDKKLTRAHIFETNIDQSVDRIMGSGAKLSLRANADLMLGISRIYSRKAKYLLKDVNETNIKINMATQRIVDLEKGQQKAAVDSITLPEVFHEFELPLPEPNDADDLRMDTEANLNGDIDIDFEDTPNSLPLDSLSNNDLISASEVSDNEHECEADIELFADAPDLQSVRPIENDLNGVQLTSGSVDTANVPVIEDNFLLPPLKGGTRKKRKRKLIVDETKIIPGAIIQRQLQNTFIETTTLKISPPTKQQMHWKKTGGVKQLFELPSRAIPSRELIKIYQRKLVCQKSTVEDFSMFGSADLFEFGTQQNNAQAIRKKMSSGFGKNGQKSTGMKAVSNTSIGSSSLNGDVTAMIQDPIDREEGDSTNLRATTSKSLQTDREVAPNSKQSNDNIPMEFSLANSTVYANITMAQAPADTTVSVQPMYLQNLLTPPTTPYTTNNSTSFVLTLDEDVMATRSAVDKNQMHLHARQQQLASSVHEEYVKKPELVEKQSFASVQPARDVEKVQAISQTPVNVRTDTSEHSSENVAHLRNSVLSDVMMPVSTNCNESNLDENDQLQTEVTAHNEHGDQRKTSNNSAISQNQSSELSNPLHWDGDTQYSSHSTNSTNFREIMAALAPRENRFTQLKTEVHVPETMLGLHEEEQQQPATSQFLSDNEFDCDSNQFGLVSTSLSGNMMMNGVDDKALTVDENQDQAQIYQETRTSEETDYELQTPNTVLGSEVNVLFPASELSFNHVNFRIGAISDAGMDVYDAASSVDDFNKQEIIHEMAQPNSVNLSPLAFSGMQRSVQGNVVHSGSGIQNEDPLVTRQSQTTSSITLDVQRILSETVEKEIEVTMPKMLNTVRETACENTLNDPTAAVITPVNEPSPIVDESPQERHIGLQRTISFVTDKSSENCALSEMPVETVELNGHSLEEEHLHDQSTSELENMIDTEDVDQLEHPLNTGTTFPEVMTPLNDNENAGDKDASDTDMTIDLPDEGVFILPPLESQDVSQNKRKRKRKLIVDKVTQIPNDGIVGRLDNTSHLTTKQRKNWNKTDEFKQLFGLPSRATSSKIFTSIYQRNLVTRSIDLDEDFAMLDANDALNLVQGCVQAQTIPQRTDRTGLGNRREKNEIQAVLNGFARPNDLTPPTTPETTNPENTSLSDDTPAIFHDEELVENVRSKPVNGRGLPEIKMVTTKSVRTGEGVVYLHDNSLPVTSQMLSSVNQRLRQGKESDPFLLRLDNSTAPGMKTVNGDTTTAATSHDTLNQQFINTNQIATVRNVSVDQESVILSDVEMNYCGDEDGFANIPDHDYDEPPIIDVDPIDDETDGTFEDPIINEALLQEKQIIEKKNIQRATAMLASIRVSVGSTNGVNLSEITSGHDRLQAAQTFISLLVLKKTKAVEMSQELAFAEIRVTKGIEFESN